MPQVRVVAEVHFASEHCQQDYRGQIVDRDKQTRFYAFLPVTCTTPDRDIDIGITVDIETPMMKAAKIPEDHRLSTIAQRGGLEVIRMLGSRSTWDIYNAERVTLGEDVSLSIPSLDVKGDVEITEALANHFREITKRHQEVKVTLEKAKKYLEEGLDYASRDSNRILKAAHFIFDCMRADGSPRMGPWNDEKSAMLLTHIAQLVKRKHPHHPNYVSIVNSIHSILHSVRYPKYWAEYPPHPHLMD